MITYLQQSKIKKNSFMQVSSKKQATHFRRYGRIFSIDELVLNEQEQKPLVMPTMNFGNDEEKTVANEKLNTGEQPLLMPEMF